MNVKAISRKYCYFDTHRVTLWLIKPPTTIQRRTTSKHSIQKDRPTRVRKEQVTSLHKETMGKQSIKKERQHEARV